MLGRGLAAVHAGIREIHAGGIVESCETHSRHLGLTAPGSAQVDQLEPELQEQQIIG